MDPLTAAAPTRIAIYAVLPDIPGDASWRAYILGSLFCNTLLHRDLMHVSGFDCMHIPDGFDAERPSTRWFDYMHIPDGFDVERPSARWFVYDLNVVRPLNNNRLSDIPLLAYLASWQYDH